MRLTILALSIALVFPASVFAQHDVRKVGSFAGAGIVENIQPGEITIRRADGKQKSFLIQNKDERFLLLDGNELIAPMPSRIDVFGSLPGRLLEKGMVIKFRGEINRAGRTGQPVSEIQVIHGDQSSILVKPLEEPKDKNMVPCDFVGIVQRMANNTVYLVVPKSKLTPTARVSVKIAKDAFFDIRSDNLNRVQQGDKVIAFRGDTLDNGKLVIRNISVELSPERKATTLSYSDRLYLKFSKLSDELSNPREERSEHFVLQTDISPRNAKVLLEKLETMYIFLARYYGAKPNSPIECFVIAEPENFAGQVPQYAIDKVRAKSGLTQYRTANLNVGSRSTWRQTQAIVYSCDDHDVVQHEAVHAFCSITFGSVGPVWYAEGMAEMGQYFVPGDYSIQIEPVLIEYLKEAKIKDIMTIVEADQITGDSWKAYAWRWALCQLLANHPNYSKRFRELGQNLMMQKQDSFKKAFGKHLDRIRFEYEQFLKHIDNGYEHERCRWQWQEKTKRLSRVQSLKVNASHGWQATGIQLEKGTQYDFICPKQKGLSDQRSPQTWIVDSSRQRITADGNIRGDGKLIGTILEDYELSEPFEIGSELRNYSPSKSGQLYLRCREKLNAISDNQGEIKVFARKSPGNG